VKARESIIQHSTAEPLPCSQPDASVNSPIPKGIQPFLAIARLDPGEKSSPFLVGDYKP
jgi:hypothetical protein